MIRLYTGTYEGRPFISSHTLLAREQFAAATIIESLSNKNDGKLPKATHAGWIIRQVAPDIRPQSLRERFDSSSQVSVHEVGPVTRQQMEPYVGTKQIETAFKAAAEEEADASSADA